LANEFSHFWMLEEFDGERGVDLWARAIIRFHNAEAAA
jgi:hypothetical protein